MKVLQIVWDEKAIVQFAKAIEYINNDSPQNAFHVQKDIEAMIDLLLTYPEKYPPDKNKIDNSNNQYRAFEKHKLRISYRLHGVVIKIIRIRHTKQNPQSY